ncbi:hypothetical protein [Parafrankia sp. EUN1f]|uniref:hypothetical protein n=1 Tax=Parafrankia sp. EUN1f TaxID=102897 RepID=UPI0001C46BF6|nr:hypothetical protein [Parafrankia sp. EUN1f]EFC80881.1 hypothetical protein FrEUN1fDRAFT_5983 [Parafrankia sp. EUN1f]
MTTIVRIPETPDLPYRLGRHIRHDRRSLRFAVAGVPTSALESKRWTRRVPVFDQGSLGSCTGQAAAGWVGTDNAVRDGASVSPVNGRRVDELFAVALYGVATQVDDYPGTYPPTDTGSDGLSVAKALQQVGLCSTYSHAFSLQAMLTALQAGPVMVGTVWLTEMFTPAGDGRLRIRGNAEGGHEYLVDEIDVDRKRVWLTNSWGPGFGLDGRAYLTWADMDALLQRQGDVTVPTPIPAAPVPVPVPVPVPTRPDAADLAFAGAYATWAVARGF